MHIPYTPVVKRYLFFAFSLSCLLLCKQLAAQSVTTDTLRISMQEAEKRFLDSNLFLLAGHFNVDAQKALIDQAKYWDNPVLNTDQVIAAGGKFLPYGKNPDGSYSGQYYIQIQQLIRTAGKRSKQIQMATTNARISELQLQDALRSLKYQLRNDMYTISFQLATLRLYEDQLVQTKKLLEGMSAQMQAGNIAQKEFLRIQALHISVEQDMNDLLRNIAETETDLKTLLQMHGQVFVLPVTKVRITDTAVTHTLSPELLWETARQNNPAYLLQQAQTLYQQQNLSYQKALRVPDLTLGPNFDRNSNYTPNYFGLGISLPLPVFNKNQGNIRSAELSVKQQEVLTTETETALHNAILGAFEQWQLLLKQHAQTGADFYTRYETMYRQMLDSYRQKQIGLLEFLDFFTDYTEARQRALQQALNLELAQENLNFYVGTDIHP